MTIKMMFSATKLVFMHAILLSAFSPLWAIDSIRMIRSLSGPSGKAVGNKFVLDEIRNRFIYPQDNALTVYFEFQAPKGDYVLTAYWKDPQGHVAAISPDIKTETLNDSLNSYWIFPIDSNRAGGIWTVEIRINGEPAGTHSFELVIPENSRPATIAEIQKLPNLDELYRSIAKSLVWVHKLDAAGRRIDTSSGFIIAPESILTAFQSIDTAARIEIECATGSKVITDEILACNRLQDWAIIKAGIENIPPLEIGKSEAILVGGQLVVFSIGAGATRTIGVVDVGGRATVPEFGERIHLNSSLPPSAIGGPLLDLSGKVVGVIGGSMTPGMSFRKLSSEFMMANPGVYSISASTMDGVVLQTKSQARTLQVLLDSGILTPPLSEIPVFTFGSLTDKIATDNSYVAKARFSRKDPVVIVYTLWEKQKKIDKGLVSVRIYDANNRLRAKTEPEMLRLSDRGPTRFQCKFSPASLAPVSYRIDLLWDGLPTWRAFFAITD